MSYHIDALDSLNGYLKPKTKKNTKKNPHKRMKILNLYNPNQ